MMRKGSYCSHCSASQLSTAQRRRGDKYPVHTMVLLGLQAPLLGEHSGNEGGRADGDTVCKTSTAAGIKKIILRGGQASGKEKLEIIAL